MTRFVKRSRVASLSLDRAGISSDTLELRMIGASPAFDAAARRTALAAYEALPFPTASYGRYWKHDLHKIDLTHVVTGAAPATGFSAPEIYAGDARSAQIAFVDGSASIECSDALRARGVIVTDLATARRDHAALLDASLGTTVNTADDKYAALALAFQNVGAFVHVPAGVAVDHPIVIRYAAVANDAFPYTVISVGENARVTVIEQLVTGDAPRFICGIAEIVAGTRAQVDYAMVQSANIQSKTIVARGATIGSDAVVRIGLAELGAALTVDTLKALEHAAGGHTEVAGLFFATGDQHVDLSTQIDHAVGSTTSNTIIKSAASDSGQARYLGNIRIRKSAHGSDSSLRDDVLLLSEKAHVDSIPALEIAANDVKAFHGATVGAIDADQLFYLMSRGIPRVEAERLIALGFFEPAIAKFPTETLRTHLREALEAKVTAQ
jgi:Fe-S cluster assembly protein SufD